jgi:hypothetical protein
MTDITKEVIEDDFNYAVIDLLGPAVLINEKLTAYEIARMFWNAALQRQREVSAVPEGWIDALVTPPPHETMLIVRLTDELNRPEIKPGYTLACLESNGLWRFYNENKYYPVFYIVTHWKLMDEVPEAMLSAAPTKQKEGE